MLLYLDFSILPIHEKDGKLFFFLNASLCFTSKFFQIFPNSLKSLEIGIFEVPLI